MVDFGKITLFLGFAYFLGNLASRFLIHYIAPIKLVVFGFFALMLSTLIMVMSSFYFIMTLYNLIIPVFLIFTFCGVLYPHVMASTLTLFRENAGAASALFGTIVACSLSLITVIVSGLTMNSSGPLSITYIIITVIAILFFFLEQFFKSRLNKTKIGQNC